MQKSSQSRQKTLYACLDRLPRWKMADYPLTVRQIRDIREVILNVSQESTYVLDAVSGLPTELSDIKDGDTIYAYIGPAMTMSLPPMTNATMIFANVPADFKVPDYVTVKSVVTDAASSQSVLTAMDGTEYTLADDCGIVPYLTRNIVTLDDLTQGRKAVVWSDGENTATRIMVFAEIKN